MTSGPWDIGLALTKAALGAAWEHGCSVEHDQPEILTTALRLGVDREARDKNFDATPEGWATPLGRTHLLPLFLMAGMSA